MEFTKEEIEELGLPLVKVISQPVRECRFSRGRILQLAKGLYPAETAQFDDDEIIAVCKLYGQDNAHGISMLATMAKHLSEVQDARESGHTPSHDPQKLIEQGVGNPLIGKK